MVSKRDQELLQHDIDGDLTPEERSRLQALLSQNPDARKLHEELRAAFTALSSVRSLEPPRTLRPGVMRAIASMPARRGTSRSAWESARNVFDAITTPLTKEAVMSPIKGSTKYSWLIAGAVVAIVAVVYFSFYYPPAPADDAQGTIGAARKYRSEQITDKDVVTGSTVTSPFAEQTMADANTMHELSNAATIFAKTAAEYGMKQDLDQKIVADLGRTSDVLEKAIELGQKIGMQKTIAVDLLEKTKSLERNAAEALGTKSVFEKNTAAELSRTAGTVELGASAVYLDMRTRDLGVKGVLEKSSIEALQQAAVTLNQAAGLYSTNKLERSAVEEVLGMAAKFEKNATEIGKNTTLDSKAVENLGKSIESLNMSATVLGQKFPAEMRSTLDNKSVLEGKSNLEVKKGLDKNAPSQD